MSMYTQLLEAALGQRPLVQEASDGSGTSAALSEVLQRRRALEVGGHATENAEFAATELARQIGYDIALMELARRVGIEAATARFEQPQQERRRLEGALRARGLDVVADHEGEPAAEHT